MQDMKDFETFLQDKNKQRLIEEIEHLENLIKIYSERDRVRMEQLEQKLNVLNMQLLDVMTQEAA